jgi:hypothetical protein
VVPVPNAHTLRFLVVEAGNDLRIASAEFGGYTYVSPLGPGTGRSEFPVRRNDNPVGDARDSGARGRRAQSTRAALHLLRGTDENTAPAAHVERRAPYNPRPRLTAAQGAAVPACSAARSAPRARRPSSEADSSFRKITTRSGPSPSRSAEIVSPGEKRPSRTSSASGSSIRRCTARRSGGRRTAGRTLGRQLLQHRVRHHQRHPLLPDLLLDVAPASDPTM